MYYTNINIIESHIEGYTSPNWITIAVIYNKKTTVFAEFHIEKQDRKYQLELYNYYKIMNKHKDSYLYTLIETVKW